MNAQLTNNFERLWLAGYRRLVPVVPPGAPISPTSTLFRALSKGPEKDPRGKAVGIRRDDGLWCGFNWVPYIAEPEDPGRWHAMGAGVGIKTGAQHDGTWLLAIDADTLDPAQAALIQSMIERHFGADTARHSRIGRAPKALYLIRVAEPFAYTRVEFEQGDGKAARIEILSDGRQFVAHGTHPVTQRPYDWPHGTPAAASVLITTPAAVNAFMAALEGVLPACKPMVVEGAASDVDQSKLRGDPEPIRKAVEATPNTPALFPEREDYRHFGYAIKAALPDDPALAFELFSGWCDKYVGLDGETNSDEEVSSDWRRMKPPFKVGASYVFRKAEETSGGAYTSADRWFEEPVDAVVETAPANPWQLCGYYTGEQADEPDAGRKLGGRKLFDLLSLGDIFSLPPPVFVIDRHIPENSLGFLYGDPGTGKSFIALDWALHLAFDKPTWHGDRIAAKPAGAVIYLTGGEGTGGMAQRAKAWMKAHDIKDHNRARFRLIPTGVDFLDGADMLKLGSSLKQEHVGDVSLIVVDTISRAMPGADENLQKEMTRFVANCDHLKRLFACAVLGVHHASKTGGIRGSTVILGAGDYIFKLERGKEDLVGFLKCEKQKDAPDGWSQPYRFDLVTLPDGRTSRVPFRESGAAPPDPATAAKEAKKTAASAAAAAIRQTTAEDALDALDGAPEMLIPPNWERFAGRLQRSGHCKSNAPSRVRNFLTGQLSAGVTVIKDGVSIFVQAVKEGSGAGTSTWKIVATPR